MRLPRSFVAPSAFLLSLAAPLLVSTTALADEACGDRVCPKGYSCQTLDASCPDIACDGPDCRPCEGTVQACVPLPCSSDADCASDMVCHTQTYQQCDEVAPCAADDGGEAPAECERAKPENCTTVSESACVPRWHVPCTTASDCGPGFTCEELMQGGCPGSEGSGSAGSEGGGAEPSPGRDADDGGATPSDGFAPPAEEMPSDGGTDSSGCVFEPSGEFACVRIETACDADSDCLPGWSCAKNNEGACWSSSDGTSGCESVDPANVCYPPYENLGYGGIAEDGGSTAGGDPSSGPGAPSRGDDAAAESGDDDGASAKASGGGCSVGNASGNGGAFGALALAFLALFGVRRRRAA